jgi:hypothetical protein
MDNIEIKLEGAEEAERVLKNIPDGAATALKLAIQKTLLWGRTRVARAVQERYNVPSYGWLLRAIGQPQTQGPLSGFLRVAGTREKLSDLPHRDIYPFGVVASIRKDAAPAQMLHAFARSGKIYEREGAGASAYPIHQIMGSSVPAMAEESHVMGEIKEKMQERLGEQVETMIRLVLSGEIIPGGRR